jgi:hypothetical protein
MMGLETNLFPIINLDDLSSACRLYRIRGLLPDQSEYYQNCQTLKRRLSFALGSPVTIIDHGGRPHLVLRDDAPEPVSPYPLVRTTVYFERVPGTMYLDYTVRSHRCDEIRLRFLQFMLQAPLSSHVELWRPGAGRPFFEKAPVDDIDAVERYRGFVVRAAVLPSGGLGLCVDVRHTYVSRLPLPAHLSPDEFRRWKGKHCIYHFGCQWYDIQLTALSDLTATELLIPRNGRQIPLREWVVNASAKPIPAELAALPPDAAVVHYINNQGESRSAPAGLCYPVYDNQDPKVHRYHARAILEPYQRRTLIHHFVRRYLQTLRVGNTMIRVSAKPVCVPQRMFPLPDYQFGGSRVLSVRGTPGAQQVSLDAVGKTRLALLSDSDAGFYVTDPLDRQYFFLPQSVADSYGPRFLSDLRRTVTQLFPYGGGYDPIVVPYNDRGPRTFVEQGNAILTAASTACTRPGYSVVMVHHTTDRRIRQHDQLAAMVIRELRQYDLYAAVMHSAVGQECYELARGGDGRPCYRPRTDKRGKLRGYLRNVALNKVLLTNERWPFVLATPLHADVTVGVDVKQHTAGFTIVGRHGHQIRTMCSTSRQKEQLLADQVKKYLVEILRAEAKAQSELIQTIVLHRDGRVWQSEREGARQALDFLRIEGIVAPDATLTILEIAKSSPALLRLFEVVEGDERRAWVENPQVGCFHADGTDGYICSTGRAFPHPGTVRPLHVRHVEGPLPLQQCLEDLYYLTALAWTRPEDCTRYPITIKLNDRRLGEDASEYDTDALEFKAFSTGEP